MVDRIVNDFAGTFVFDVIVVVVGFFVVGCDLLVPDTFCVDDCVFCAATGFIVVVDISDFTSFFGIEEVVVGLIVVLMIGFVGAVGFAVVVVVFIVGFVVVGGFFVVVVAGGLLVGVVDGLFEVVVVGVFVVVIVVTLFEVVVVGILVVVVAEGRLNVVVVDGFFEVVVMGILVVVVAEGRLKVVVVEGVFVVVVDEGLFVVVVVEGLFVVIVVEVLFVVVVVEVDEGLFVVEVVESLFVVVVEGFVDVVRVVNGFIDVVVLRTVVVAVVVAIGVVLDAFEYGIYASVEHAASSEPSAQSFCPLQNRSHETHFCSDTHSYPVSSHNPKILSELFASKIDVSVDSSTKISSGGKVVKLTSSSSSTGISSADRIDLLFTCIAKLGFYMI